MSTPEIQPVIAEPPVLFEEVAAGRFRIGVATLNRPRQLNALNLQMCQLMLDRFRAWQSDDSIVAVVHISNKLELLAVRSACIGHLVSRVQDSNMEQMLALGQELACTELVDAAKAAIRKRSGYGSPNGEDKRQGKSRGRKVFT